MQLGRRGMFLLPPPGRGRAGEGVETLQVTGARSTSKSQQVGAQQSQPLAANFDPLPNPPPARGREEYGMR